MVYAKSILLLPPITSTIDKVGDTLVLAAV
jgi:hypothetical protein